MAHRTTSRAEVKDEVDDLDGVLDEDDEEYDPRLAAAHHGEDDLQFETARQLPQSNVARRPLGYLMRALDEGVLDINPDYQREVVWTAQRMTGLINSIMENYYIPPIILNGQRVDDTGLGHWKRICVDGKQRLSSVQAFVQGKIPCHDKDGNTWYFCNPPDTSNSSKRARRILPDEVKHDFLHNKEFIAFEFRGLSSEQEEDLFARVQMGMQLNPAEKMRASTGPWQDFAKMFEEDFKIVLDLLRSNNRAAGFRLLLTCFTQILEVQHPSTPSGKPVYRSTAQQLFKFVKNKDALDEATKSHLASVFTTFKDLVELDPGTFQNSGFRHVQTFAPVELIAIAVLISVYGETRNHNLLLGDIRAMRLTLRQNFIDLRLNQQTWVVVWEFIDTLEQFRGAVDGGTIVRQIVEPPTISPSTTVTNIDAFGPTPTAPAKPKAKSKSNGQKVAKPKPAGGEKKKSKAKTPARPGKTPLPLPAIISPPASNQALRETGGNSRNPARVNGTTLARPPPIWNSQSGDAASSSPKPLNAKAPQMLDKMAIAGPAIARPVDPRIAQGSTNETTNGTIDGAPRLGVDTGARSPSIDSVFTSDEDKQSPIDTSAAYRAPVALMTPVAPTPVMRQNAPPPSTTQPAPQPSMSTHPFGRAGPIVVPVQVQDAGSMQALPTDRFASRPFNAAPTEAFEDMLDDPEVARQKLLSSFRSTRSPVDNLPFRGNKRRAEVELEHANDTAKKRSSQRPG